MEVSGMKIADSALDLIGNSPPCAAGPPSRSGTA